MSDPLPPLREAIEAHGLAARKSLGQNFLLDLNLTGRIARSAGDLTAADVLEIGPGFVPDQFAPRRGRFPAVVVLRVTGNPGQTHAGQPTAECHRPTAPPVRGRSATESVGDCPRNAGTSWPTGLVGVIGYGICG